MLRSGIPKIKRILPFCLFKTKKFCFIHLTFLAILQRDTMINLNLKKSELKLKRSIKIK